MGFTINYPLLAPTIFPSRIADVGLDKPYSDSVFCYYFILTLLHDSPHY